LPETGRLAERLGDLFKPRSLVLTGMKASKASFLKDVGPHLTDYGRIVFATHGFFSMRTPGLREPFLALTMVPPGTDGFLTMSNVLSLKLNADLVALTACQTGLGRELSGEGVMSMGRAFQYAGAKSVIMTLWEVQVDSALMLIETFFQNLKAGKGKLEALTAARDQVKKAGYRHPFFWAPFILVGEAQ
jgi:CHAT domain-containing protein